MTIVQKYDKEMNPMRVKNPTGLAKKMREAGDNMGKKRTTSDGYMPSRAKVGKAFQKPSGKLVGSKDWDRNDLSIKGKFKSFGGAAIDKQKSPESKHKLDLKVKQRTAQ